MERREEVQDGEGKKAGREIRERRGEKKRGRRESERVEKWRKGKGVS